MTPVPYLRDFLGLIATTWALLLTVNALQVNPKIAPAFFAIFLISFGVNWHIKRLAKRTSNPPKN